MDFKNMNEFVENKFSKGTTPLTLITSFSTSDTIAGINAALVLADRKNQQVPLSELISKKFDRNVYVQSQSHGTFASVAILCFGKKPKPTAGKNWKSIESYIENNLNVALPVKLLVSSTCPDTIRGKNCVKVLAATKDLSERIKSVLLKGGLMHSVHILSESSEGHAAITIVIYHDKGYNSPHGMIYL